jgi:hypothetical protein
MVAFQSADKALACASAIQKALLARNDSAEEPVKVRMGLHAGEVIKEGEDFFGPQRHHGRARCVVGERWGDTGVGRHEGAALRVGRGVGRLADGDSEGLVGRTRNLGGRVGQLKERQR